MGPSIRAMYHSPQVLRGALKWSSLPMRYCSVLAGVSAVLHVVFATALPYSDSAVHPGSALANLLPHRGCFAAAVQSWPWRVQLDAI